MKMLKSEMLYADVLASREVMMEEKKKRIEEEKKKDAKYHEITLETVARLNAIEEAKLAKQAETIKQIAIAREEQLRDVRTRKAAEVAESIAIGEAMRREAEQRLIEDMEAQKEKQRRIAESNAAMVIANEKFRKVRDEIRAKEKEAEESRAGEVEIIEGRKIARKAIEIRRFERQQLQRQAIIDAAIKQLKEQSHAQNVLQLKQEEEIRAKQDKYFADKEAKRQKEWDLTVQSRTQQIAHREQMRREQEEEDAKLIQCMSESNAREQEKALEKERAARENTKIIKAMQYADGIRATRKKVEDRILQIEQDKLLVQVGAQDDKKFTDVVKEQVIKYAEAGKPTYTIRKCFNYAQPDLMGAKLDKKPKKKQYEGEKWNKKGVNTHK